MKISYIISSTFSANSSIFPFFPSHNLMERMVQKIDDGFSVTANSAVEAKEKRLEACLKQSKAVRLQRLSN